MTSASANFEYDTAESLIGRIVEVLNAKHGANLKEGVSIKQGLIALFRWLKGEDLSKSGKVEPVMAAGYDGLRPDERELMTKALQDHAGYGDALVAVQKRLMQPYLAEGFTTKGATDKLSHRFPGIFGVATESGMRCAVAAAGLSGESFESASPEMLVGRISELLNEKFNAGLAPGAITQQVLVAALRAVRGEDISQDANDPGAELSLDGYTEYEKPFVRAALSENGGDWSKALVECQRDLMRPFVDAGHTSRSAAVECRRRFPNIF